MKGATLFICDGSRCRKARHKDDRLTHLAQKLPLETLKTGCQKICKGPVVGLRRNGTLEWFERMNTRKALGALEKLVKSDVLRKPLKKRRSKSRTGKLRT